MRCLANHPQFIPSLHKGALIDAMQFSLRKPASLWMISNGLWVCVSIIVLLNVCRSQDNAGAQLQPMQRVNFLITASPQEIPANGKSTSIITVQVDDPSIPDGTEIHFISSMADTVIEPSAILRNRIARVTLRAGTTPGVTTVTAFFGTSRKSIEVRLLPPSVAMSRDAQLIIIKGRYLAYSPGDNFITASGSTRFIHMGLVVECDVRMNVFLDKHIIVAEGEAGKNHVSVSNGEKVLKGDRLVMDYARQHGTIVQTNPQPRRFGFKSALLLVVEEAGKLPRIRIPQPNYDINRTWIKAREIVVYPREKIVFRRAQLFMKGTKLISLPIHVMPLTTYGLGMSTSAGFGHQYISYNSYAGLQIDLPLYFHADLRGTGALRLQYFGKHGFGVYRPGFTLSLEEQYVLSERSEGVILLEAITRPDWNIRMEHMQQLGSQSQLRMSAYYLRQRDLLTRLDYFGRVGNIDVGIEAYYNKSSYGSNWNTQLMFQLPMRTIGKTNIGYSIIGYLSWGKGWYGAGGPFTQGVDIDIFPPMLNFGRNTSLSLRGGVSLYHSNRGLNFGLSTALSLNHRLKFGTLSLSYNYDRTSFGYGIPTGTQSIGLNFYGNIGRTWSISLSGAKMLSVDSMYGYMYLNKSMGSKWRLRLGTTYQSYSMTSYLDYDISLAHRLGNLWVSLNWQKSRGKIYLQIGSYTF